MPRCFGDEPYGDEPWTRAEPCATAGCDGTVEHQIYVHCYRCRCEAMEKAARKPVAVKSEIRKVPA